MKNTLALEQLKLFEKKLVEINNCKLKSNFDIRYLRSLYDLRCNVENVEESEEKISIEYNGYKENKNRYTISILVKNNSKDIASLNDM